MHMRAAGWRWRWRTEIPTLVQWAVLGMLLMPSPAVAQPTMGDVSRRAFEVDLADVVWNDPAAMDRTSVYSILHVDSLSGATQMLFRAPPRFRSSCHWHSSNESNIVLQGSIVMRHGGIDGVPQTVGGFSFVPKEMNHQISAGPTVTIIFSMLDGPFDITSVADSLCNRGHP